MSAVASWSTFLSILGCTSASAKEKPKQEHGCFCDKVVGVSVLQCRQDTFFNKFLAVFVAFRNMGNNKQLYTQCSLTVVVHDGEFFTTALSDITY